MRSDRSHITGERMASIPQLKAIFEDSSKSSVPFMNGLSYGYRRTGHFTDLCIHFPCSVIYTCQNF